MRTSSVCDTQYVRIGANDLDTLAEWSGGKFKKETHESYFATRRQQFAREIAGYKQLVLGSMPSSQNYDRIVQL